jgi:hypothetical protein
MKKSPVALVRERFQSKEQLVEAVQKLATGDLWLDRVSGQKGLAKVSNQKLLKLYDVLSDARERFGTRDKLIDAILALKKRTKDAGYSAKLKGYPLPRLLDLHQSAERAGKRATKKAEPKRDKPVAKAAPAVTASKKTSAKVEKKAPASAAKKAPSKTAKKK